MGPSGPSAAAVAVATAVLTLVVAPSAAGAASPVRYQPPVDAPLIDQFRPPGSPYGAGNRGIDYLTAPGTPVGAAGPGEVTFAAPVGGQLHVVVLHADGVRTSYSFLASVAVRRGQRVAAGQTVGVTAGSLHFGARIGDTYVDPLLLFGAEPPRVHLMSDHAGRRSEAGERSAVEEMLRDLPGRLTAVNGPALDWLRRVVAPAPLGPGAGEELRAWLGLLGPATAPPWLQVAAAVAAWRAAQATCTPPQAVPPRPAGRRLAVLVGGLGSDSGTAAVDDVDATGLGYAPEDVVRFSYRGSTTAERPYAAADTQVDIRLSGRRLRALLDRLHADHPGVPIDVVAHSQGGLVARWALGEQGAPVANLVTLGSPHHGADLATAAALVDGPRHPALVAVVARLRSAGVDPGSVAVQQLSETSSFVRELQHRPLPPSVVVTSIAARGDAIVASPRSRVAGATNVVVTVEGLDQHADLPGSAAARREVALALAGMRPTCESLADVVADTLVGDAVVGGEDAAGLALAAAGR